MGHTQSVLRAGKIILHMVEDPPNKDANEY